MPTIHKKQNIKKFEKEENEQGDRNKRSEIEQFRKSELLKEFKQRIEQGEIIITRPDEQKAELMIYSQDGKYGLKVCCTEEGIKVK